MTLYRQYRGLYGEPVRVAERTISNRPPIHYREPFPFARAAARLGDDRDRFAHLAQFSPFIGDAEKSKALRRFMEPAGV